ncbi:MAG: thiamine phosphate synthase, partial [Bacteroidia bacterium]|nr:thiamine phosphate synthase [Bacteroidia bacterium]
VNYIGLGPFRFTTTKENLSPVLGLKGYQNIISSLPGNAPPIFAIGGIQKEDIPALLQIGVYGIAVSSLINQSNNKSQLVEELNSLLYESVQNC